MFSGQTQVGVAYEDIHLLRMGYNSSLSPGIIIVLLIDSHSIFYSYELHILLIFLTFLRDSLV